MAGKENGGVDFSHETMLRLSFFVMNPKKMTIEINGLGVSKRLPPSIRETRLEKGSSIGKASDRSLPDAERTAEWTGSKK